MADSNTLYAPHRVDNQKRWDFIKSNLKPEYETALDMGCADGYFCMKLGQHGLDVTGVDTNDKRIRVARKNELSNVQILKQSVRPDYELPVDADVVLMLTFHHHFSIHYDRWAGIDLLNTVLDKVDCLFYEVPGDMWIPATRVKFSCKHVSSGEVYDITEKLKAKRYERFTPTKKDSWIQNNTPWTKIGQDLPDGKYIIKASSPWFEDSNWKPVKINDYKIAPPIQLDVDPEFRKFVIEEQPDKIREYTTHNREHYDYFLTQIMEFAVVDSIETGYSGGPRNDYLYAVEQRD